MTARLTNLCFDANDPRLLAGFWAGALDWVLHDEAAEGVTLAPKDGTPFLMDFIRVPERKVGKNRIHLDLVSESSGHQAELVERLLALGASRQDVGQPPDAEHVVLGDPEGNEFDVVVRGAFLATTGLIGAVVFEPGNPAAGHFWSEAIGWPLVYEQDGDTAIRAPEGRGPFITFGPPSSETKTAKGRLHLDIAPPADGDQAAEVERLLTLGATKVDIGQGDVPWVVMADPDGNEFCVLTPR